MAVSSGMPLKATIRHTQHTRVEGVPGLGPVGVQMKKGSVFAPGPVPMGCLLPSDWDMQGTEPPPTSTRVKGKLQKLLLNKKKKKTKNKEIMKCLTFLAMN